MPFQGAFGLPELGLKKGPYYYNGNRTVSNIHKQNALKISHLINDCKGFGG
jgi:hypothetical protein